MRGGKSRRAVVGTQLVIGLTFLLVREGLVSSLIPLNYGLIPDLWQRRMIGCKLPERLLISVLEASFSTPKGGPE